jgi:hypothetical protein
MCRIRPLRLIFSQRRPSVQGSRETPAGPDFLFRIICGFRRWGKGGYIDGEGRLSGSDEDDKCARIGRSGG